VKKKRDRTQQHLDELRRIRNDAPADSLPIIRAALASPSNFVVAKAADIAGQQGLHALTPHLLEAFERFIADAPRLDKGCAATTAIVKALYTLDYQQPGPYLRGIRHHQMEGLGPVDVAAELRGASAMGLAQSSDDRAVDELVLLLTDPEAPARMSAARAIGCRNESAVIPVLLLKVHVGDPELEVLAECMIGMLAVALNDRTLALVSGQLDSSDPDRAEAAALALGTVRDDRAFEVLRAKWDSTAHGPLRQRLLHAMAVSRNEGAIGFLCRLAAEEPVRIANLAIEALSIHWFDARIAALAAELAQKRPDCASAIRSAFNRSTLDLD
jgi:HEAT repeat protein